MIKTLLCFDYGSKRIGAAIGQTLTGTATPLQIIRSRRNCPDWDKIRQMIEDWKPDAIVVGVPLTMEGHTQDMTVAASRFARQLEGRFHLPVVGVDERLSTFEAKKRAGDSIELDSVAAQAILETWLAAYHNDPQVIQNGNNNNE